MEAQYFAAGAYFSLLLVLVFFITLSLILVYSLNKELKKSLSREEEGSVYSRAILLAQEDERMRISRKLHDTVAQDLWRLSFQTESIDKASDAAERKKLCAEVVRGQKELMRLVRGICDNLIPPDFQRRHFDDSLRNLCNNFEQRTGIKCRLVIQDKLFLNPGESDIQLQCFRIVQECLTNIEKHSGAAQASVLIRKNAEGEPVICVSDEGKGFSPPGKDSCRKLRTDGHYGLWNIYERAASLSGVVTIESEAGKGASVTLRLTGGSS
ncbi:MAG: sensor histidine kinase [Treponema sp.]|jgi:signal transduction histidine kinase|nr:sensor histidine kinase [Treponema sp.]